MICDPQRLSATNSQQHQSSPPQPMSTTDPRRYTVSINIYCIRATGYVYWQFPCHNFSLICLFACQILHCGHHALHLTTRCHCSLLKATSISSCIPVIQIHHIRHDLTSTNEEHKEPVTVTIALASHLRRLLAASDLRAVTKPQNHPARTSTRIHFQTSC